MSEENSIIEQHDVADLIRPTYVNKEVMEEEGKEAVIIASLGVRILKNKQDEDFSKAFVQVQYPSGRTYEFGMTPTTLKRFRDELDTTDLRYFVGAHVKMELSANKNWIDMVIIKAPEKKK